MYHSEEQFKIFQQTKLDFCSSQK